MLSVTTSAMCACAQGHWLLQQSCSFASARLAEAVAEQGGPADAPTPSADTALQQLILEACAGPAPDLLLLAQLQLLAWAASTSQARPAELNFQFNSGQASQHHNMECACPHLGTTISRPMLVVGSGLGRQHCNASCEREASTLIEGASAGPGGACPAQHLAGVACQRSSLQAQPAVGPALGSSCCGA